MRNEKKLLLDEIKGKIEISRGFIVTKHENLTTQESWTFRNALTKNSSEMEVVKKRIFLKALEQSGYSYKLEELDGHIAVIFVKPDGDLINIAKIIVELSDETNKIQIIRGEIDNKSYLKEDMIILSKLPSLNELRSQFLGLLEAPMSQTLSVFQSLLTSVIYALEEKKKLTEKK
jgi:large subunit ribosomal protein L10